MKLLDYVISNNLNVINCDFASPAQKGFQNPATPVMEGIIDVHNYVNMYLAGIAFFVCWLTVLIVLRWGTGSMIYDLNAKIRVKVFNFIRRQSFERNDFRLRKWAVRYFGGTYHSTRHTKNLKAQVSYTDIDKRAGYYKKTANLVHGSELEFIWTVVPSLILLAIASPSFILLYSIDELVTDEISLTVKVLGHQWFWSYQVNDNNLWTYEKEIDNLLMYDSYMVQTDDLKEGQLRLLEVDNPLVLPIDTYIRVIVGATDVLHSWAIPSLGVKIDAVPGRLNQTVIFLKREGVFYGQCSEICGVNHGFMPIKIVTMPKWWFTIKTMYYQNFGY